MAQIYHQVKVFYLGTFELEEQAAIAFDVATSWVECFGDFDAKKKKRAYATMKRRPNFTWEERFADLERVDVLQHMGFEELRAVLRSVGLEQTEGRLTKRKGAREAKLAAAATAAGTVE